MFSEQINELVDILTSVGFSTTILLLTHQKGIRPEAFLV